MKRSFLKRKTGLKRGPWNRKGTPPKKRKRLAARSAKKVLADRQYSAIRALFLEQHPNCRVCEESVYSSIVPATEIHHIRGRGALQNDVRFFLPVCWNCHKRIENHKKWAWDMGYRASRDRKAMQQEGLI